jgi:hypothetical protein
MQSDALTTRLDLIRKARYHAQTTVDLIRMQYTEYYFLNIFFKIFMSLFGDWTPHEAMQSNKKRFSEGIFSSLLIQKVYNWFGLRDLKSTIYFV